MFKKILLIILLILSIMDAKEIIKTTSLSIDDNPKYKKDFKYFDYVNPNASKEGKINLASIGSFDSFNPFIIKGIAPSGIDMLHDTLLHASEDEPFSRYPLIASSIEYPEDRSWVIFEIDNRARFSDGEPIGAEDVKFSFDVLISKGSPTYKRYYADVKSVEVLSKNRVKFSFKGSENRELMLIISELPILPKHYWEKRDFGRGTLEIPVSSGAYTISDFKPNRTITYKRDDNYWGKNLPVNIGRNNFKEITYDYYRDDLVSLEAFKAGEYDFREEYTAKSWANLYTGKEIENGIIKKESIKHEIPRGFQGFFFNTRRDIFKDIRVRKAINYAFDFEWSNKNLFFNQYKRTESFFENSEFKSSGIPKGRELEILKSLKNPISKEIEENPISYPTTDGSGNIRENLKKAVMLLREAGYSIKDKKMAKDGKTLSFEILISSPAMERVVLPFKKNLELIGVDTNIRVVDPSQYINRVRDFDFDMIVGLVGQSMSPGNEQRFYWGSEAAHMKGSRNFAGIERSEIDELIDLVISAPNRDELIYRVRALDRVLLWGYYVIPHWYSDEFRVAYWDKFQRPKNTPKYSLGFDTWWVDEEKEKKLYENYPKLKR